MKERGILFSAQMVRAILDGTKTQTRRIFKTPGKAMPFKDEPDAVHQDGGGNWIAWDGPYRAGLAEFTKKAYPNGEGFPCPYGQPGDKLWVRETWKPRPNSAGVELRGPDDEGAIYRATWDKSGGHHWKPSIFMPRWASRITLEITAVRVERLQDISAADVIAEGVWPRDYTCVNNNWQRKWIELWDGINGKSHPWESNPWLWVLEFRRIDQ